MKRAQWRLVRMESDSGGATGSWNMAVDEAILDAAGSRQVLPTLRLYAWAPPCLSLGFAQPVKDADRAALARHGWDLVRRPTGGRAILHTDELTYSVITPLDEPRMAGGVLESYCRLAEALVNALQRLGLPAQAEKEYALPAGSQPGEPVCFEVPSSYEITVGGKKLVGSAQARRKDGILQHGSLPLYGDLARITQALAYYNEESRARAAARLMAHAANAQMLGRSITWTESADAFVAAFKETLNLDLIEEPLTPAELERASALVEQKYGNPAWTERV